MSLKGLTKTVYLSVAAGGILSCIGYGQKSPKNTPPRIGIVKNADDLGGGGCKLQLPSDYKKNNDRSVFLSDDDDRAVMNIDGADVRLSLESFEQVKAKREKGRRFVHRYRGDGLAVRVDFTVTKACDPKDVSCAATWFNAEITVIRESLKRAINVRGTCGV